MKIREGNKKRRKLLYLKRREGKRREGKTNTRSGKHNTGEKVR